jgi:putative lipoprotein
VREGEGRRTVRGTIVLPASGVLPESATVRVQIEDVSRADAPSIVVGEQCLVGVQLRSGAELPFTVEVPESQVDHRRIYSVRAHVDTTGSGDVKAGDLVSTQSHPVLTRGYGSEARVPVRPV